MNLAFISDLHLSEDTSRLNSAFFNFLSNSNHAFDQLFILGDLFEAWVGDDDDSSFANDVCQALLKLSKQGTEVFFIHGNRDFLIGENFMQRSGVKILPDPFTFQFFDLKIALSHGDSFCTDDVDYQNFKKEVRTQEWQSDFLAKPLAERKQIAANMRDSSQSLSANKASNIMDVNDNAVQIFAKKHGIDFLTAHETEFQMNIKQAFDYISKLGFDPLTSMITLSQFKHGILKLSGNIKKNLLDQSFVCGIGNWICDDVVLEKAAV